MDLGPAFWREPRQGGRSPIAALALEALRPLESGKLGCRSHGAKFLSSDESLVALRYQAMVPITSIHWG